MVDSLSAPSRAGAAESLGTVDEVDIVARASRTLATARRQSRVARNEAARFERRSRHVDHGFAWFGAAGLACGVAGLVPGLPLAAYTPLGALAVCLGAVPLKRLFVRNGRVQRQLELALKKERATAAVSATASRLAAAVTIAASRDDRGGPTPSPIASLLADLEGELATVDPRSVDGDGTPKTGRRHGRIVPRHRRIVIRTSDGRSLIGTIKDVSTSGVALSESLPRVALGEKVTLGSRQATIVRIWDKGVAFTFTTELDAATFDETIVL